MECDANGVPKHYGFIPQPLEPTRLTAAGELSPLYPVIGINSATGVLAFTMPANMSNFVGNNVTVYANDNEAHTITFPNNSFGTNLETLTFAGTANMESVTFRCVSPTRAIIIAAFGVTLS